ncbi:MAG: UPF0182 family protein [Gemmatimonadales bacterium]
MTARGRRVAGTLAVLALALAAGHWVARYRAERLWEASVASAVATAGARRALAMMGLELLGVVLATSWLLLHFGLAARIALPIQRPRGGESRHPRSRALVRWSVAGAAAVAGVLVGSGLGGSLDHLRFALTEVRLGLRDPLAGRDLGTFLGSFPFWSAVQRKAVLLAVVALGGAGFLHAAGGSLRLVGHRLRVAPAARGQLAVLLATLGAVLAWDLTLEPLRLAAGQRGPLLPDEFALRSLLAYLIAGLGLLAGLLSLLWWVRIRGGVPLVIWLMFVLGWTGMAVLPVHPEAAHQDPGWRAEARTLDALAFGLGSLERSRQVGALPVASLKPTLWDDSVMTRVMGASGLPHRGWLAAGGQDRGAAGRPVWIGFRVEDQARPTVIVASDDQASPAGAPLFFEHPARDPEPAGRPVRARVAALVIRPHAARIALHPGDRPSSGVPLGRWLDRLALAWAWQAPLALAAPRGARLDWHLDPAVRLAAVAPFARWTTPRLRLLGERLFWQSDGVLISPGAPSSGRVRWSGGGGITAVSLARAAFMGVIDAETGTVRIFRRTPTDSLASAWARVAAPVIEPAESIPPALREGEAYPVELAMVQARVLAGPAWDAGRLAGNGDPDAMPSEAAGGGAYLVPFVRPGSRVLSGLLSVRRTPAGDSVALLRFDPLAPTQVPSAASLRQQWERFPFRMLLGDSILAVGARFQVGAVRYALTEEGVLAYQPAWAASPGGVPRLVLVNVALGKRLGTGRDFLEAWRNLQGETSPIPMATGTEALLAEVRRWWWYADSALKRGDLGELARALQSLRELLERRR